MRVDLCRATRVERLAELPGDQFILNPLATADLAITIAAPPSEVWPWIVQMGSGRAGWYSYDHIDNGGVSSARKIVPALQELAVGDIMPWLPGATDGFVVGAVANGHAIVLLVPVDSPAPDRPNPDQWSRLPVRATSALVLEARGGGSQTRLIARGRVAPDWLAHETRSWNDRPTFIERVYWLISKMPTKPMVLVALFGHYLFQARELRGLKRRAELHWRRVQNMAV